MAAYLTFASGYYVKHGKPTREFGCISEALREVRKLHETTLIGDFGPRALKAVQAAMVELGWCRKYINKQVGRIVRMVKWGVSEELVAASIHQALSTVSGLRKGRTEAPDHKLVAPVPDEDIEATLTHLPPLVAEMVRFQRLVCSVSVVHDRARLSLCVRWTLTAAATCGPIDRIHIKQCITIAIESCSSAQSRRSC